MTEKDIILSKWLQGEASDQEVRSVFGDIDLDYLRSTLETQNKMEIATTDPKLQWDLFESKLSQKQKPKTSNYLKWLLLGVLLFAGGYLLYSYFANSKTVITPKSNNFMEYAFEDGSDVRLWPGSKVSFDEGNYKNDRLIQLEGEAFFKVTKGASFKVKTAAGEVQVLGTSFNVWSADQSNTYVKCYTGRVQVTDNNNKSVLLTPGEQVSIANNKITNKSTFNVDVHKIEGTLKYYDNAKIEWVLDDIKKLYNIEIDIKNQLNDQRFTGAISLVEINQALSYLCEPMHWSYEEDNKVITIKEEN